MKPKWMMSNWCDHNRSIYFPGKKGSFPKDIVRRGEKEVCAHIPPMRLHPDQWLPPQQSRPGK